MAEEINNRSDEKSTMPHCGQQAFLGRRWSLGLFVSGYVMFVISFVFFHFSVAAVAHTIRNYNIICPPVTRLTFLLLETPLRCFILIMLITVVLAFSYRKLMNNTYLSSVIILVLVAHCATLLFISLILAAVCIPGVTRI